MKRTQMTRKTPLKSGGPLARTGGLARSSALTRTQQAAKKQRRTPRTPEEVRARQLVTQRSGGICEVCGNATATNWHHRQNRSGGGQWTAANGMAVCGTGTTGCHGHITTNPQAAREQGWAVPSWADPARTAVWIARRGFVLLDNTGSYSTEEEVA